jgi:hypothetical protein
MKTRDMQTYLERNGFKLLRKTSHQRAWWVIERTRDGYPVTRRRHPASAFKAWRDWMNKENPIARWAPKKHRKWLQSVSPPPDAETYHVLHPRPGLVTLVRGHAEQSETLGVFPYRIGDDKARRRAMLKAIDALTALTVKQ